MRGTSSPVFISLEIQKQTTVTSASKVSLKSQQNTRTHLHIGIHKNVICGRIKAMTTYILSDVELHISKKLTALKKGINNSEVQFFPIRKCY